GSPGNVRDGSTGSVSSTGSTGGIDCDSGSPGAGSGHRNVRDGSVSSTGSTGGSAVRVLGSTVAGGGGNSSGRIRDCGNSGGRSAGQ
ncbi:MAG: hypothetical protein IKR59_07290, partial [Lachnospiraceae bacterium]|nr:hypothetical protein [Lachnospiraceae bacterium]